MGFVFYSTECLPELVIRRIDLDHVANVQSGIVVRVEDHLVLCGNESHYFSWGLSCKLFALCFQWSTLTAKHLLVDIQFEYFHC